MSFLIAIPGLSQQCLLWLKTFSFSLDDFFGKLLHLLLNLVSSLSALIGHALVFYFSVKHCHKHSSTKLHLFIILLFCKSEVWMGLPGFSANGHTSEVLPGLNFYLAVPGRNLLTGSFRLLVESSSLWLLDLRPLFPCWLSSGAVLNSSRPLTFLLMTPFHLRRNNGVLGPSHTSNASNFLPSLSIFSAFKGLCD